MSRRSVLHRRLALLDRQFSVLMAYHDRLALGELRLPSTLEEQALQDAYLKRFSFIQDYLGAKIFPLWAEAVGLPSQAFTQILSDLEREGILKSVELWAEMRELRNALEHEYPEELERGLETFRRALEAATELHEIFLKLRARTPSIGS